MADIVVREVWQNLIENYFREDVKLDPDYVERFFVSNKVQRSLAHLVGQTDEAAVRIRATAAGELKVAPTGAGYEHNLTIDKFAVADAYAEKTFTRVVSRVDITTWSFGIVIKRKPTAGAGYEGEIEIPANTMYSFDCSTIYISVKNAVPGSNASCHIVGWY